MNLLEAFKQLDSLNEETFSVDADGIKKLSAFTQSDDSGDELDVFDLDAMDDEEAIDACHLNDVILDCCVCHSKIFAPADKLVVDEETSVANAGEECPYCYSVDGYKVIGQVAPIEHAEVRADSDSENKEDVDEKIEESKELSTVEGTLGNVLDAHKNELSRLTTAKEISEFLETIKPEIKNDQQAFVDTVIEKVKRLPDMKALQYVYNIILKGDNLSTKMDANKKRLTASVEDDYYVGDEDGGRIYHGCAAAKKAAKKLADSGVKVIMHKVENELKESINESLKETLGRDTISMLDKRSIEEIDGVRYAYDYLTQKDLAEVKDIVLKLLRKEFPNSTFEVYSITLTYDELSMGVLKDDVDFNRGISIKLNRFDYSDNLNEVLNKYTPQLAHELIDEMKATMSTEESLKESTYNDYGGIMGEPGEQYTDADLKSYWDSNNSSDPVLNAYKGNYDAWLKDTISNMHRVNEAIMKRLEAYVSNINEAEMSDEDKHDSELIRSMIDKMQARSNAAFTPEEQAIMQKYNINRNNTSRNLTVDGRDLAREVDTNQNYYSSKNNGNPEKINYADRARKLSQRKDNQIFNQPYSADNDDINVHGYKRVAFSDLQDAERYNQNVQMQEPVNTMKNELRNRSYAQNRIDNAEKNRADRMAKAQAAFDKAKAEADRNYNYDTEYSAKERDIAQANIDKLLKRRTNESLEASEVIEPVSDEVKDQIELDVDEFDDESFDKLTESFLKQNYSNIDSYKTKNVTSKGNKFFVEGIIKFESGKERKTSFLFEAVKASRNNKIRLIGENINFAKDHKSLSLVGSVDSKQLISESLAYNYKQKDESGKIKTIRGSVKSK